MLAGMVLQTFSTLWKFFFMPVMRGRDEMSHWPFFDQRHIFDTKFPV
jgi:hypothetical protein